VPTVAERVVSEARALRAANASLTGFSAT